MKQTILILIILLNTLALNAETYTREELEADLRYVANLLPARVGISFISDRGDTISINSDKTFPLMSVMKFHQALAVCDSLNRSKTTSFDTKITVDSSELNPKTYSPMLTKYPKGGTLTIRQLLDYSLILSDNNASNILYNHLLSVRRVNLFAHELIGLQDTCAGFYIPYSEEDMGMDVRKARENYTTPFAANRLMSEFYALRKANSSYKHLWKTMSQCKTGQNRIPRHLTDRRITIVHKTGTGGMLPDGTTFAVNDVACVIMPNGRYYFLSVFVCDAKVEMSLCEDFIANISQIVYDFMTVNR